MAVQTEEDEDNQGWRVCLVLFGLKIETVLAETPENILLLFFLTKLPTPLPSSFCVTMARPK